MVSNFNSLLPPSATPQERAQEQAGTEQITSIPELIRAVKNPDLCPVALLPWLAWEYSVDTWNVDWSEQEKRDAIKRAAYIHQHRGTRAAIEMSLSDSPFATQIVEWFEKTTRERPYSFSLDVVQEGAVVQTDIQDLKNAVLRAKNLRSWFDVTFYGETAGGIILAGWMRANENVSIMPSLELIGVGVNDWMTSDFSPSTSFAGAVYSLVIQGAVGAVTYSVTSGNATVNEAGDVTVTGPGVITVTATDSRGSHATHTISPHLWVVFDGTMALPGDEFNAWLASVGARAPTIDDLLLRTTPGARGIGSLSLEWGNMASFGWDVNGAIHFSDKFITSTSTGVDGQIYTAELFGEYWGGAAVWGLELNLLLSCCGVIESPDTTKNGANNAE